MQVDNHFGENVLLSMEKLIKYVKLCLKGKFCAYGGDSRKSSQASYQSSLDDQEFGNLLFSLIPIENVHIQLNDL